MYALIVEELERNLKKFDVEYYQRYLKTMYLSEYLITRDKTNLRLEVLEIFYYLKNKSNQNIEIYLENNCKSVYLKIFLTYILCKKSDTEAETKTLLDNLKTKYEHVPEYQSFKFNLKKIDILLSMKIFDADKLNKISFDMHINRYVADEMFDFIDIKYTGPNSKEVLYNSFDEIIVRICVSGGVLYHQTSKDYIYLEKGDILVCNQLFFNKMSLLTPQSNILVYQIKSKILIDILNKKMKQNSAKKLKISHFEILLNEINKDPLNQMLLIFKLLLDITYYYDSGNNNCDFKFLTNYDFTNILEYIDSNLEKRISVKDLEQEFNIYNSALIKLFLEHLGVLPSEYLLKQKLMRAAVLLKTTSYKVNYISDILSFSSSNNFSAAFKKSFGISPLKYRKEKD